MKRRSLNLPKKFLGCMPLFIGVETALVILILNKCSGAYGILALFTGHPLEFMQWVFYLWSVISLLVFTQGLYQMHKPSLLTFSQIFVTLSIDTIFTCFFTAWFTAQWYTLEDTAVNTGIDEYQKPMGNNQQQNQGASETFEYGVTMLITLVSLVFKLYFNFLLASYVQELLLHPKYMVDQDDVEQDLKHKSIWKKWWIKSQKSCYKLSKNLLT